jgi:hypothetical protein
MRVIIYNFRDWFLTIFYYSLYSDEDEDVAATPTPARVDVPAETESGQGEDGCR